MSTKNLLCFQRTLVPENKKQCSRQLQSEVPCRWCWFFLVLLVFHKSCSPQGGGPVGGGVRWGKGSGSGKGSSRGRGLGGGRGGMGHFIHLAIYCTTIWCFTLKGLRTIRPNFGVHLLCKSVLYMRWYGAFLSAMAESVLPMYHVTIQFCMWTGLYMDRGGEGVTKLAN